MKFKLAVLFAFAIASFAVGQTPGAELAVAGLKDKVTVRRDARWIPYIEAKNNADLFFAQGYVVASDRLWQMDLLRRVVRGETAEIFGKMTLPEDRRWRRYGFAQIVEESLKYYTPEMRVVLEDYARGVNAYIATLDDASLPVEFKILQYRPREWKPTDTVLIGKLLAEALSSTYQRDLMRESIKGIDPQKLADLTNPVTPYDVVLFGKDLTAETQRRRERKTGRRGDREKVRYGCVEHPTQALRLDFSQSRSLSVSPSSLLGVSAASQLSQRLSVSVRDEDMALRERSLRRVGLYAEDLAASNNWVISGKRTAEGKPLLANDPHLEASAPGIWYLAHLLSPNVRVSGVTFPGTPGIVLGHNEHIAWGATNVGPDVQDLYLETIEGKKSKTAEGWADLEVRKEKIGVRANPLNPDLTYETFEVTKTKNGPIIVEADGKKYSLRWTALDPKNNEFETFYFLNKAKDWNSFQSALKLYGGATQNFIYADVKGNIGWYAAGRIPIRKTGDGSFPYDGSTNAGDWTAFVPFDELPHLYNPPEGFIMTANQRIVGTTYKYQQVSRDAAPPWRARRLYDLLKADSKATMDSVNAAQQDAVNIPLQMLAKDLIANNVINGEELEILKTWDGRMIPESRAALFLNEMRVCASNKIAADNKPVPAYVIRERILFWAIKEKSARWIPKPYSDFGTMLKACEAETVSLFSQRYGADRTKWVWGLLSVARFNHPLAVTPLIGGQFATPKTPLSGSGQTPNVASYVSMRHIASPGNWDATRHVIPLGQSGDPKSPYFKDQFEAWRTGTPAVFPFSKTAVEAAAKTTIVLTPK